MARKHLRQLVILSAVLFALSGLASEGDRDDVQPDFIYIGDIGESGPILRVDPQAAPPIPPDSERTNCGRFFLGLSRLPLIR